MRAVKAVAFKYEPDLPHVWMPPKRKRGQDPSRRQVFECPECGWRCERHLNAALNLLRHRMKGVDSPRIASAMRSWPRREGPKRRRLT